MCAGICGRVYLNVCVSMRVHASLNAIERPNKRGERNRGGRGVRASERENHRENARERENEREQEREVGGWGRDPKKCTGRDWGMGSSTIS